MAETAVLLAVQKISFAISGDILNLARPLLAKKDDLVAALPANMKLVKEELELINEFLNSTGMVRCNDAVFEAWIVQIRRLAYGIQDIVDEFIYVVAEDKEEGFSDIFKKNATVSGPLFSLHEIAADIGRLRNELKELSQQKDRWLQPKISAFDTPVLDSAGKMYITGHTDSVDEDLYNRTHCCKELSQKRDRWLQPVVGGPVPDSANEQSVITGYTDSVDEYIGIERSKEMLTELLHSEYSGLRTISVWGMGGVGKSSLVNYVYQKEKLKFDCHALISVSQSYKMDDILRQMLKELYGNNKTPFDTGKLNSTKLREKLQKFLDKKRYLIILDDVWTHEALLGIANTFVDQGKQSRVIVTTRVHEVASVAEGLCKINLEPLNEHDAWTLFCRKAFRGAKDHSCPPRLESYGKNIVAKCKGLPLALVAIGSLLSSRTQSEAEWKRIDRELIWELHNNPNLNHVVNILNLSYSHLPFYLKNCFLYCAMFPEDHILRRKKLIRLWIAEGFVEKGGQSSLEDVAEHYLLELAQRSMIQVVRRNTFGTILRFRMHDLVRELAILLSKRECFNLIYDDTSGAVQVGSDFRRLSLIRCNNDIGSSLDQSMLHTFLAFDTKMALPSWSSFIPSKSKYMAVLDLSSLSIDIIPDSVGDLFNLKYLCLDDTNVKSLPTSIIKLQNLQTVSLKRTKLSDFPDGCAKLKKLRHLLIWKVEDPSYKSLCSVVGVEAFVGLWNLEELQTLDLVRASEDLVAKVGNLTQLRCLCIFDVKNTYCAQLCSSLSKMQQLRKLNLKVSKENEVLQLETLASPPPLEKLVLEGRLAEGTLESPLFSACRSTLVELRLIWCQLAENPIPPLSKLSNLTALYLKRAYTGQQLSFCAGWFPNLKRIVLRDLLQVYQIHIANGALVSLELLLLDGLKELKDVPNGAEFLSSIQEAHFSDLHPDFQKNLQISLQMGKLNNIPKVVCK